jgi:hypothetical protein
VSEVAEIQYIRQTETCSSHRKTTSVENRSLAPRQRSPPSVGHPVSEVFVTVVRFSSNSQRTGMCRQILLQLSKYGMSLKSVERFWTDGKAGVAHVRSRIVANFSCDSCNF